MLFSCFEGGPCVQKACHGKFPGERGGKTERDGIFCTTCEVSTQGSAPTNDLMEFDWGFRNDSASCLNSALVKGSAGDTETHTSLLDFQRN
jgi:hypothetical protein